MKKTAAGILLLIILLTLSSCGGTNGLSVEIKGSSTDTVVQGAGGAYESDGLSVGETGVLRIKDNHLLFFDYESKKDYVICSRANCKHSDDSCSGWYTGYYGAMGLAEYGGKLYCFINNEDENVYELIQMNLDGNQRKVIMEIDRGDSTPGTWEANLDLSRVYYAGNKVITTLNWYYNVADKSEKNIQTQQCIAVDLESGELLEITERVEAEEQCYVEAISKDYCIVKHSGFETEMLTEDEFYEQYEKGEFSAHDKIMKAENPYEMYYDYYFDETEQWYKYILFDLNTKDIRVLYENFYEKERDENGEVSALKAQFDICSLYRDDVIIEKLEESWIEDEGDTGIVKDTVYKWNLKTGKKEKILNLSNGYVFDAGGLSGGVLVDQEKILFLKRKEGGKADYSSYSLKTGTKEFLYEAERNVPYRIIGETKDSFIYYTADDTKKSVYMMKKDDYYKGNFDNSNRLKGLDEYF